MLFGLTKPNTVAKDVEGLDSVNRIGPRHW